MIRQTAPKTTVMILMTLEPPSIMRRRQTTTRSNPSSTHRRLAMVATIQVPTNKHLPSINSRLRIVIKMRQTPIKRPPTITRSRLKLMARRANTETRQTKAAIVQPRLITHQKPRTIRQRPQRIVTWRARLFPLLMIRIRHPHPPLMVVRHPPPTVGKRVLVERHLLTVAKQPLAGRFPLPVVRPPRTAERKVPRRVARRLEVRQVAALPLAARLIKAAGSAARETKARPLPALPIAVRTKVVRWAKARLPVELYIAALTKAAQRNVVLRLGVQ